MFGSAFCTFNFQLSTFNCFKLDTLSTAQTEIARFFCRRVLLKRFYV